MITLRPFQRAAIDATWAFLRERDDNPCIVLPTGSGKSHVAAAMIHEALTQWPGSRIIVLAHVRELVAQNAEKLRHHWPEAPLGIHSAGLKRRDRFEPVIFASIQSVYTKSMQLGRFDLVIIDEAHRVPLHAEGQYRQFLADQRALNPILRVVGMTATPYRLGGGPVCGPDYILNDVSYEANVADLIRDGYLCKLVSRGGTVKVSLSDVHVRKNEYVPRELEAAVSVQEVVDAACDEIVTLCADRNAWLVFCAGIHHAKVVAAALQARGIACAALNGTTPAHERNHIISEFRARRLRALVNINVLSEGFDAPHIDAIIMLRPTLSAGLYYQQVGRGFRLSPSKENCLVLDYADNIIEHGPIDAIRPPRKPGQRADSDAPVRECPQCHAFIPAQSRSCPECSFEFPVKETPPHDRTASDAAILSGEGVEEAWHTVTGVYYAAHTGKSGIPTLQVTYTCGLRSFKEWVCLEHSGMARGRAVAWWLQRDQAFDYTSRTIPRHVSEALPKTDSISRPLRIRVRHKHPFPEIIGYDFNPNTDSATHAAHEGGHAERAASP